MSGMSCIYHQTKENNVQHMSMETRKIPVNTSLPQLFKSMDLRGHLHANGSYIIYISTYIISYKTIHPILLKLTVYYIYEKVTHDIICYLHDRNHGNKIILEILMGDFAVSSMENLN